MSIKNNCKKNNLKKVYERESKFWDNQVTFSLKDEKDLLVDEDNLNELESFIFERLGDLRDKKVLDCGCGSGVLSTILAKRGALVSAFDISSESTKLTKKRAEINGVGERVEVKVMPFEKLGYSDQCFDLVVGYFILHHIDVIKGALELKRVLKDEGRAIFLENSSRNFLLMMARKLLTGRFGIPKHGSADEIPLGNKDIKQMGKIFSEYKVHYKNFFFFRLLDEFIFKGKSKAVAKILKILDVFFYKYLPLIRQFSYLQIAEFNKVKN